MCLGRDLAWFAVARMGAASLVVGDVGGLSCSWLVGFMM
jgi:hypothetical protein